MVSPAPAPWRARERLEGKISRRSTGDRYKWIALSNTTLATLIATIDLSVVLIAMRTSSAVSASTR